MLQKSEDIRQQRFLEEVERLNLRFPGKEIVKRTGYNSGIVSEYLNSKKNVSESFLREFCKSFDLDYERDFVIKPSQPGSPMNMKWAMLKMLYQRVAKADSERLGLPIEQVMKDMDNETMIAWRDLESKE